MAATQTSKAPYSSLITTSTLLHNCELLAANCMSLRNKAESLTWKRDKDCRIWTWILNYAKDSRLTGAYPRERRNSILIIGKRRYANPRSNWKQHACNKGTETNFKSYQNILIKKQKSNITNTEARPWTRFQATSPTTSPNTRYKVSLPSHKTHTLILNAGYAVLKI